MRTLIVEDHAGMSEVLTAVCEDLGFSVACAPSGAAAARLLEDEEEPLPGLIVVDLDLRLSRGGSFLEWLARHRAFAGVPLLVLSGAESERPPGVRWLEKPFSIDELSTALEATKISA
jgi:DNA-binding response OmpR family regulator